jgi:hypothetical protein
MANNEIQRMERDFGIGQHSHDSSFSSQFFGLASSAALDERMSGLISQVNQGVLPGDFKPEDQVIIRMRQGAAVRVWEGLFRSAWASTKQLYTIDFIIYFESLPWNE